MNAALLMAALTAGGLQDRTEQEKSAREEIASKIRAFQSQKKRATLGLLREAVNAAITYGAPVYSAGEPEICARFYAGTSKALVEAFDGEEGTTARARGALAVLKEGLARSEKQEGADARAWALRYSFDRMLLEYESREDFAKTLILLGNEYYQQGHYEAAASAFGDASGLLEELAGTDPKEVDLTCRIAPLARAHALFAQEKFEEAARTVEEGIPYLPNLPKVPMNRRKQHPDPDDYDRLLKALQAKVKKEPASAALEFLLGYELYFAEQREEAQEHFVKALKIDAKHAGARLFVKAAAGEDSDF